MLRRNPYAHTAACVDRLIHVVVFRVSGVSSLFIRFRTEKSNRMSSLEPGQELIMGQYFPY